MTTSITAERTEWAAASQSRFSWRGLRRAGSLLPGSLWGRLIFRRHRFMKVNGPEPRIAATMFVPYHRIPPRLRHCRSLAPSYL